MLLASMFTVGEHSLLSPHGYFQKQVSENTDYETDLSKAQSGCVVDVNFNSKLKELTATGKVITFGVCLLLNCCLEAGKLGESFCN